jgi:hypothetical protein
MMRTQCINSSNIGLTKLRQNPRDYYHGIRTGLSDAPYATPTFGGFQNRWRWQTLKPDRIKAPVQQAAFQWVIKLTHYIQELINKNRLQRHAL